MLDQHVCKSVCDLLCTSGMGSGVDEWPAPEGSPQTSKPRQGRRRDGAALVGQANGILPMKLLMEGSILGRGAG